MRSIARALVLTLVVAGIAGSLLGPSTQPVLGLTLVAVADTLTMVHDRTAVVPPPGVLGNDVGLLGGATAVLDGPPSHGSVTLRPDGGYTYTPNAGYVGTDVLHYHARNGGILPLNSTSTTVTITITNASPVARNDAYTTTVAGTRTVSAPGVMANDADPDGDPIQASLVTGPAHGTVSLAADGSFAYASVAGYSGSDAFTYRVSDGIA
ncbi:MAG: Ig-like domain-containing protein, partial [Chloroflexota bacterium]|nr:Ig-like domain-containing protein [Chloroflexota bacterium]